ncbi:hypothetical protein [Mycetocola zhadangensis]|uniref:Uncharacterized protein n=1 Tax=Mycetocola zhadangensis TaxID=1164595 RepID=A0A3L7J215_9MICO|nr:hypothetical protein [Mycetocola zhadangensis]RLQ84295.1 hypothetical protein D9V28_08815 [Mycetocola zhadangensis]GGE94312.1 hypothetical protein GCM10011313_16600 [Mycetocola zhadangensis]
MSDPTKDEVPTPAEVFANSELADAPETDDSATGTDDSDTTGGADSSQITFEQHDGDQSDESDAHVSGVGQPDVDSAAEHAHATIDDAPLDAPGLKDAAHDAVEQGAEAVKPLAEGSDDQGEAAEKAAAAVAAELAEKLEKAASIAQDKAAHAADASREAIDAAREATQAAISDFRSNYEKRPGTVVAVATLAVLAAVALLVKVFRR